MRRPTAILGSAAPAGAASRRCLSAAADGRDKETREGLLAQLMQWVGLRGTARPVAGRRDWGWPGGGGGLEVKPYMSWEELVGKTAASLRFARDASERGLTRAELDDAHLNQFGFTLGVRQSHIRRGGRGVFLTRGALPAGAVLTLFPGTVYTWSQLIDTAMTEFHSANSLGPSEPGMPLFMFRNRYLLQETRVVERSGGVRGIDLIIDGNPYGQSALRFLRNHESSGQVCDKGWLELEKSFHTPWRRSQWITDGADPPQVNRGWTGQRSKMSMGHLLNHVPADRDKDVDFYFVQLPADFDPSLLRHVPSINAKTQNHISSLTNRCQTPKPLNH